MSISDARRPTSTRTWGIRITGTLLFLGVLVVLDLQGALRLEDILAALGRADPLLVAFSIVLYVPFLAVKGARWRIVNADMLMPISWPEAWRIYAIGLAAGTFTPGQAGDALKAWYVQRMGYPLARGLGGSVLDRLFDVAALAVLGLLGVAVYGQRFAGQTPALVGLAALCLAAVAFFAWSRTRTWAVNIVAKRLSGVRGQGSGLRNEELGARGEGREPAEGWSFRPVTLVGAGLLTVGSFATSIFRVWLLAAALGVWLGPLEVSGFVGLTTAAALVPVTVGGVGTRDFVAALAFVQLGRAPEEGVAISALILLLNFAQAVAGWLVWLRYDGGRNAKRDA